MNFDFARSKTRRRYLISIGQSQASLHARNAEKKKNEIRAALLFSSLLFSLSILFVSVWDIRRCCIQTARGNIPSLLPKRLDCCGSVD